MKVSIIAITALAAAAAASAVEPAGLGARLDHGKYITRDSLLGCCLFASNYEC